MAEDWGKVAQEVSEALASLGPTVSLVLRRTTTTGGDPWDPIKETVDYPFNWVSEHHREMTRDGTLIGETRHTVTVDAVNGIVPSPSDVLVIDGKAHAIIEVRPIAPVGTPLYYEIDVVD